MSSLCQVLLYIRHTDWIIPRWLAVPLLSTRGQHCAAWGHQLAERKRITSAVVSQLFPGLWGVSGRAKKKKKNSACEFFLHQISVACWFQAHRNNLDGSSRAHKTVYMDLVHTDPFLSSNNECDQMCVRSVFECDTYGVWSLWLNII